MNLPRVILDKMATLGVGWEVIDHVHAVQVNKEDLFKLLITVKRFDRADIKHY